jgi:nitroreductase
MPRDNPEKTPGDETGLALVGQAILAPSSHNTQPWRFRIAANSIELHADRTRALPVNDPYDRELTISCGCALANLVIAARHYGRLHQVEILPQPWLHDLLARVRLARRPGEPQPGSDLYPAIPLRRTYRMRFAERAVPPATLEVLINAARAGGAWLLVVSEAPARHALAELIAEGDRLQWADPRWRRELAAWMDPSRSQDGIAIAGVPAALAPAVVRTFDMGGGVGARDLSLVDESPVLAILGTTFDTPHDWIAAGEALEMVLLSACRHGLQASFLNQPIQVSTLRERLKERLGREGHPQVLLRLGYPGKKLPPSRRRPVGDVIERAPAKRAGAGTSPRPA